MRASLIWLLLVFTAGSCFAEDPLESLNTVEDTVSTMQSTLKEQGHLPREGRAAGSPESHASTDGALEGYFLSDGELGNRQWIMVKPCSLGAHVTSTSQARERCGVENGQAGFRLWKWRAASAAELKPGMLVAGWQEGGQDGWFVARVTDLSDLEEGYVGVSAPFKAPLEDIKIVEE